MTVRPSRPAVEGLGMKPEPGRRAVTKPQSSIEVERSLDEPTKDSPKLGCDRAPVQEPRESP